MADVMHQIVERAMAVLLRILEIGAELRRRLVLEDHRRLRRRHVPVRRGGRKIVSLDRRLLMAGLAAPSQLGEGALDVLLVWMRSIGLERSIARGMTVHAARRLKHRGDLEERLRIGL